jgi:hypothetical protein
LLLSYLVYNQIWLNFLINDASSAKSLLWAITNSAATKKIGKKKKKEAITYGEEDFVKGEGVFFFIGKTCTKFHSDIW